MLIIIISNQSCASCSSDFEVTCTITPWIVPLGPITIITNWTEWSTIQGVIVLVISNRPHVSHSSDFESTWTGSYLLNCTPLGPMTITKYYNQILVQFLSRLKWTVSKGHRNGETLGRCSCFPYNVVTFFHVNAKFVCNSTGRGISRLFLKISNIFCFWETKVRFQDNWCMWVQRGKQF